MKQLVAITLLFGITLAQSIQTAPKSVPIPRDKVKLTCQDDFFKVERVDFLLEDENYLRCRLQIPLALKERWPGRRTFYVVPRVSASLSVKDKKDQQRWVPLAPLNDPGQDPFHGTLDSARYTAVELVGSLGKISDKAAGDKANVVSAGGKITVCVSPVFRGELPCVTFDLTARFKVYTR